MEITHEDRQVVACLYGVDWRRALTLERTCKVSYERAIQCLILEKKKGMCAYILAAASTTPEAVPDFPWDDCFVINYT